MPYFFATYTDDAAQLGPCINIDEDCPIMGGGYSVVGEKSFIDW